MTSLRTPKNRNAFSLVEVVIALGIVSFAIITLLALIPTGMSGFQQAQTSSVETQIVQQLNTELQNTPYTALFDTNSGAGTNTTVFGATGARFYDMEGEMTNSSSPNPPVYIATMTSYPFTNVTGGTSANLTNSSHLILAQTVQINLAFHNQTNSFTTLVVYKGY
jgi:uncharacterized protein (TIGR02598 family)